MAIAIGYIALVIVLTELGVPIVPHAVRLSLGGTEPLDRARVDRFVRLAKHLKAPPVSHHATFVPPHAKAPAPARRLRRQLLEGDDGRGRAHGYQPPASADRLVAGTGMGRFSCLWV
ncbi:DUF692 domain-containing protein, partial [Frankia tisae]